MSSDEQADVLVEIRDILRGMAEIQKTEHAANSEYRKELIKLQESVRQSYDHAASRGRREVRLWFAFLAALIVIAFMSMTTEITSMIRGAAKTLNIPEFKLPDEETPEKPRN